MLHEVSFASFNGRDTVQGWIYVPAAKPKGIVQLVHGFGEHSRRYLYLIVRFLEAGYIVSADDHVGHGKTAMANNTWGDWGDKGCHTMREDEHTLMKLTREKYPDLPYFMYGHSMGSFITRDFAAAYGDELDGIVICGTSGTWPNAEAGEQAIQKICDEGGAKRSDPEVAGQLMGWMFGRCSEGVKLGNEWICSDPYVQKDHAMDPFDAFARPTTNLAMLYFIQMLLAITGPEWAAKVPKALPVYNIGGDQDPVGQYGRGVYEVSNWLIDSGHEVTTKLYSGYRHEIHNYKEIKGEVADGILAFLDGHLPKQA